MAVIKEIKNVKAREINKGTMEISLIRNRKKCRIMTLYSQNIKETLKEVMKEIKEEEEEYLMTREDFNARIWNKGDII